MICFLTAPFREWRTQFREVSNIWSEGIWYKYKLLPEASVEVNVIGAATPVFGARAGMMSVCMHRFWEQHTHKAPVLKSTSLVVRPRSRH